jgi:hypothetical protein
MRRKNEKRLRYGRVERAQRMNGRRFVRFPVSHFPFGRKSVREETVGGFRRVPVGFGVEDCRTVEVAWLTAILVRMLTWPSLANIDKRQERLCVFGHALDRLWPCVRSLIAETKVRSRRFVKMLL